MVCICLCLNLCVLYQKWTDITCRLVDIHAATTVVWKLWKEHYQTGHFLSRYKQIKKCTCHMSTSDLDVTEIIWWDRANYVIPRVQLSVIAPRFFWRTSPVTCVYKTTMGAAIHISFVLLIKTSVLIKYTTFTNTLQGTNNGSRGRGTTRNIPRDEKATSVNGQASSHSDLVITNSWLIWGITRGVI